jgi:hypothetical protein
MPMNFPDTPVDGATFVSGGSTWVWNATTSAWKASTAPSGAPLYVPYSGLNAVGRNQLHNGLFNVQQRGLGPWSANTYTADRWINGFSTTGGSCSSQIYPMGAGSAGFASEEACQYVWQGLHTAGTGAGDYFILRQFMENVRRFSGKTMTVSFWAWCASGTPKVCVECAQQFGSGGSPSTGVLAIGMTPITISTTPTRYSVTFTIPSVFGKIFGTTTGTDFFEVNFWMSAGATYSASRAGGIGFQSNTFAFWGIQFEFGSVMTPLEKLDYQIDFANCQRFFQVVTGAIVATYGGAAAAVYGEVYLPTQMRIIPTIAFPSINYSNCSALTLNAASYNHVQVYLQVTAAGNCWCVFNTQASAEL